jgi:multidrug efflux system membrane fusion protein
MTSGQRIIVVVVGLAAVTGVGFVFLKQRTGTTPTSAAVGSGVVPSSDRAVPVTTAVVVRRDVPVVVEGLGTVTPLATVAVRSQVDGRLDHVYFVEGQKVKRGELLAQIDPRPFTIQLHTAEATFARDEATLKNAQLDLGRYEKLREGNLIPQQQLDTQRALVAQLDASARTDQAAIENARLQLDYARITSPVDGVTGIRLVDPGNIVRAADTTGIVIVTQLDPIGVVFTLPQDDLPSVQRAIYAGGDAGAPSKPSVEAYARDGADRLGSPGTLELVDNEINTQTATIRLKAKFNNPNPPALWPNQFVKARLKLETLSRALVVPAATIQRGPKGNFVYVVDPNDKSVSIRNVDVKSLQGDDAIVSSGLREGETVVTDGQNQLRPGAKVVSRAPPTPGSGTPPAKPHGSREP